VRPAPPVPGGAQPLPVGATVAAARVAALLVFLGAVVATPTRSLGTFAVHAGGLSLLALLVRVPAARLRNALLLEVPVVAFAALLPLLGVGPHVAVGPLDLSVPGLWEAWSILARATLGLLATTILLATMPVADVLAGCGRLRLPSQLVAVAGFALRYGVVVQDDARRMRLARAARGDDPRWIWQARGLMASTGALFVRSFERGERVHRAMLARGYDGRTALHILDPTAERPLRPTHALLLSVVPIASWTATGAALVLR